MQPHVFFKIKTGQKGVLFSVMVLFLLLAVFGMQQSSSRAGYSISDAENSINAYSSACSKYANVRAAILQLPSGGDEKTMRERFLPFTYGIDSNRISLAFDFPARPDRVQSYLEVLNYYRVFTEDMNYGSEYDSMQTDINMPVPQSWGGSGRDISFRELPHCFEYSVTDYNTSAISFSCEGHDFNSVKRIDLNISLNNAHDFNSLSCTFNGVHSCPDNDYNSLNSNPYLNFSILDSECASCGISPKRVRGHYSIGVQNNILLKCIGPSCTSPQMDLNFSQSAVFRYNGGRAAVSIAADLNSGIESFSSNDVNISVSNDAFGVEFWG